MLGTSKLRIQEEMKDRKRRKVRIQVLQRLAEYSAWSDRREYRIDGEAQCQKI